MSEQKRSLFGVLPDNRQVMLYRLENASGVSVEIMDLGGIVRSLRFPDRNGVFGDIVMGHENLREQMEKGFWLGGICGRCVNRIGGDLVVGGKTYALERSYGDITIHGGKGGYMGKLFAAELCKDSEGEKLRLYHRDRGEGGFPGEVDVWITYVLTPENEFKIRYKALPTMDTVFNPANHAYFNLGGHDSGSVADHLMQIDADFYLPGTAENLPTGEIRRVDGTVFDFRKPRRMGDGFESGDEQILLRKGYDHNFCVRGIGFRKAGHVTESNSGRSMTVYTDMPGMQLYTSNDARPGLAFKDGVRYAAHDAFCLETQFYPNATAHSHFISPIACADVVFKSETVYKFTVDK